jgi:hypothetical protein
MDNQNQSYDATQDSTYNIESIVAESSVKKQFDVHPMLQREIIPEEDIQETIISTKTEENNNGISSVEKEQTESSVQENKNTESKNWREVRAQAEEAKQYRREVESLERERDFYRQQALQKNKENIQEDYRTDTEKHLYQQMEELKQQLARNTEETEKAKKQASIAHAEQRLQQEYPDIKEVLSEDNVHRLEIEYPHLYKTVTASNDLYSVGAAAYELIVAKGIHSPKKNNIQQLVQSNNPNKNRPRSASTIAPQSGETPIHRAGNFMGNSISSEEERKALWKEMVDCMPNKQF